MEFIRVKLLVDFNGFFWLNLVDFFDWLSDYLFIFLVVVEFIFGLVLKDKGKTKKDKDQDITTFLYRSCLSLEFLGGINSPEFRTLVSTRLGKPTFILNIVLEELSGTDYFFTFVSALDLNHALSVLYRKFVSYRIPEIVWDHPRLIYAYFWIPVIFCPKNHALCNCVIPEVFVILHSGNCLRSPMFDLAHSVRRK